MPVKKVPGNPVIGATINKSGSFRYKATEVGADTARAQIVKLVHGLRASDSLQVIGCQWVGLRVAH
jgi:cation transport ATPase